MPEGNITAQTDKRLFVLIDDRCLSASIISVIYSGSLQTAPPFARNPYAENLTARITQGRNIVQGNHYLASPIDPLFQLELMMQDKITITIIRNSVYER